MRELERAVKEDEEELKSSLAMRRVEEELKLKPMKHRRKCSLENASLLSFSSTARNWFKRTGLDDNSDGNDGRHAATVANSSSKRKYQIDAIESCVSSVTTVTQPQTTRNLAAVRSSSNAK